MPAESRLGGSGKAEGFADGFAAGAGRPPASCRLPPPPGDESTGHEHNRGDWQTQNAWGVVILKGVVVLDAWDEGD